MRLVVLLLIASVLAGPALARKARPSGARLPVPSPAIRVMDGDTAEISWSAADVETVRVLGIDTAELFPRPRPAPAVRQGLDPRGAEARGFARGAFAAAERVELLRAATLDRWGRTLGYFFLDGRNYSVLAVEARLARETITRYGDNGFPNEARAVLEAARRAGRTPKSRQR